MNEREIIELAEACGRRVCDSEHHHGCPYGDESMVDCVERLERDYDAAIQRLLTLADANTEDKSAPTTYTCIDREHNTWQCGACGHMEAFEADGPMENGWDFCPHCARRIAEEEPAGCKYVILDEVSRPTEEQYRWLLERFNREG